MLINTEKLNERIQSSGMTIVELAEAIGINKSTYYRKLKGGGGGFVLWELKSIIRLLGLNREDVYEIFLA